MTIVIVGAGVQGTLYGVRLARAGHQVTLVARGARALELRDQGAVISDALSGRSNTIRLPVLETLPADTHADLCLVTVRREQLEAVLPNLAAADEIDRVVFMVNHANGSKSLFDALGRQRVVLGFPGAAGGIEYGVDRYVEIPQQATAIEYAAPNVAAVLRGAGFRVELVRDMDSWLRRHAVFVTALSGALYQTDVDTRRLSSDADLVRTFILAVREGWKALDGQGVAAAPLALRTIFCRVPLPLAVLYWRRLIGSPRGEYYFAHHTRHAAKEMAALSTDVCSLVPNDAMPRLRCLYDSIHRAASDPMSFTCNLGVQRNLS